MRGSRFRWLVALLLPLALVAAACGDDDDGDAAPTTTAADGATTTEAPTTTTGEDGGEPSGDGPVSLDDSGRMVAGACEEGENNADPSIGVTADSVNFALVSIDFGPLAQLGFAASGVDVTGLAQPFIDAVNEAGGVCGRTIDYQPVLYDIIRNQGGQACLQVTEDRTNLVVFGQGGFNEAMCIAEAGTVVYGQQDFAEPDVERAGGADQLLFARNVSVDDAFRATVDRYLPDLEGKKVGVWYGAVFLTHGDAVENGVLPVLDEAGIDYVAFRTDTIGPSDPEGGAIMTTAATEFVSNRVDVVLGFTQTTNHVGLQGEMAAQGYTPTWLWSNVGNNSSNDLFAKTYGVTEIADGERLLTYTYPPNAAAEQPAIQSCNEQYTELSGESFEPGTFEYQAVANICHQIDLLVALLTWVGPDISQAKLIEAFESLPTHPMGPLLGGQQWGPGIRFGNSTMAELLYDGSTNTYSLNSDLFEVG